MRQLLDMTSGLQDPDGLIVPQAVGLLPRPADYAGPTSIARYLSSVRQGAAPGTTFEYKTADAEILAWILARVTGKSLSDLYRERLWIPLQMERDGYFTIDSEGLELGSAGLNATLRDVARFGEMVRLKGQVNGKQIIPKEVFTDIYRGGSRELYKASPYEKLLRGWSYRSFWWVSSNADSAISGIGIHGQNLFINPKAEMVIVRLASHPDFMAGGPVMRAYDAVAQFLNR